MTTVNSNLKVGPLKSFALTMGFREQDFSSSPISIPTSEPVDPQITYTVQQSDMPTITPSIPLQNVFSIYMTGANSKAAASTLSFTIFKNGVSVITTAGSSIANTQNTWGLVHWRWNNVQVGDVLAVKVWATTGTATGFTLDYSNLKSYATQPDIGNVSGKTKLLKDLKITTGTMPSPTISPPNANGATTVWNVANNTSPVFYPTNNSAAFINVGSTMIFPVFSPAYAAGNTGLYRVGIGDLNGGTTTTYSNTTNRQYQNATHISAIEYREVR